MALTAAATGGSYQPVPQGTHLAICYALIDLGTQTETFEGRTKSAHKVRIVWELPNERNAEGKPLSIGTFYSVSLHEKAKLRKDLQAWRSKPFTEDELKGFQLVNIVGKPCMLSVIHKARANGDGVSDSIASVSAVVKGLPVPAQENKTLIFDLDAFDRATYDGLPDFLKKMIAASPEGQKALGFKPPVGGGVPAGNQPNGDYVAPGEGVIPF